ncbi:MAG: response regulator transcription factor [Lachnospiraceae bacterium]|nr:response regulator transcription factor [Lachnospiraceae bacterium]
MIYCVEDDSSIREMMIYMLKVSGFEARGFGDSSGFWPALKNETPELVLLDIMLPGEDGLAVLNKLRSKASTADIPVIMTTAKGTEYDKVVGLDAGADDYLAKPFGMMEMVSRIKAVLRRSAGRKQSVMSCGSVVMNENRHLVTVEGKPVTLTLKEYELLKLFVESPGRVFTRDTILTSVWSSEFMGETRTVDVHVGTLRTKLGPGGDMIQTVRGVGYKMEAGHEQ